MVSMGWGGSRQGGRSPLKLLVVLALVGGGIFLVPKMFGDDDEWTFEETLPGVIEDFGEDARVVSVVASPPDVTYAVIDAEGTLRSRRYYVEVESIGGEQPREERDRRTEDSERAATPKERQAAKVTLGELDSGVVERMWDEVDFPSEGSSATLSGRQWALAAGTRPLDRYLASFDGSNLQRTKGPGGLGGGDQGGGRAQGPTAEELTDCVAEAGQDPAAIQRCVGQ